MGTKEVWEAVSACTGDIVNSNAFREVVACHPYFEGWWTAELARRFRHSPEEMTQGYRLVGVDLKAVSELRPLWFPDLVLDRQAQGSVREMAWVELKLLNLCRPRDGDAGAMDAVAKRKLRVQTQIICKAFCKVWKYGRKIDILKTAQTFAGCGDLQNLPLPASYRDTGAICGDVSHVAAAFLLAVIPDGQDPEFKKSLESVIVGNFPDLPRDQRKEMVWEVRTPGLPAQAHLVGLLGALPRKAG